MADALGRDAGVRPAGGGRPVGRRQALAALAALGGEAALAGQGLAGDGAPSAPRAATGPGAVGYAPDGVAGRTAAFPLSSVRLLERRTRRYSVRGLTCGQPRYRRILGRSTGPGGPAARRSTRSAGGRRAGVARTAAGRPARPSPRG